MGTRSPPARSRMGGGQAVHAGHEHVEDDEVGPVRGGLVEGVETVDGEFGPVALEGEAALQRLAYGRFVVDDQDALLLLGHGLNCS